MVSVDILRRLRLSQRGKGRQVRKEKLFRHLLSVLRFARAQRPFRGEIRYCSRWPPRRVCRQILFILLFLRALGRKPARPLRRRMLRRLRLPTALLHPPSRQRSVRIWKCVHKRLLVKEHNVWLLYRRRRSLAHRLSLLLQFIQLRPRRRRALELELSGRKVRRFCHWQGRLHWRRRHLHCRQQMRPKRLLAPLMTWITSTARCCTRRTMCSRGLHLHALLSSLPPRSHIQRTTCCVGGKEDGLSLSRLFPLTKTLKLKNFQYLPLALGSRMSLARCFLYQDLRRGDASGVQHEERKYPDIDLAVLFIRWTWKAKSIFDSQPMHCVWQLVFRFPWFKTIIAGSHTRQLAPLTMVQRRRGTCCPGRTCDIFGRPRLIGWRIRRCCVVQFCCASPASLVRSRTSLEYTCSLQTGYPVARMLCIDTYALCRLLTNGLQLFKISTARDLVHFRAKSPCKQLVVQLLSLCVLTCNCAFSIALRQGKGQCPSRPPLAEEAGLFARLMLFACFLVCVVCFLPTRFFFLRKKENE